MNDRSGRVEGQVEIEGYRMIVVKMTEWISFQRYRHVSNGGLD